MKNMESELPAQEEQSTPEMVCEIIRADRKLSQDVARALCELFSVAYKQFSNETENHS